MSSKPGSQTGQRLGHKMAKPVVPASSWLQAPALLARTVGSWVSQSKHTKAPKARGHTRNALWPCMWPRQICPWLHTWSPEPQKLKTRATCQGQPRHSTSLSWPLTSSDTLNLRSSATTFCLKFCCCKISRGSGLWVHIMGRTQVTPPVSKVRARYWLCQHE